MTAKYIPPLTYLRQELGFTVKEYKDLPLADREDLKRWAKEEMEVIAAEG